MSTPTGPRRAGFGMLPDGYLEELASGFGGGYWLSMFPLLRRLIGRPRYVRVIFDWRVERDGVLLGTLREPRRIDMFWREVTFEPAPTGPGGVDWYDDRTWETGDYVIRHGELDMVAPHGVLQAFGKPPFLNERGIPELLPVDEMDRASRRLKE